MPVPAQPQSAPAQPQAPAQPAPQAQAPAQPAAQPQAAPAQPKQLNNRDLQYLAAVSALSGRQIAAANQVDWREIATRLLMPMAQGLHKLQGGSDLWDGLLGALVPAIQGPIKTWIATISRTNQGSYDGVKADERQWRNYSPVQAAPAQPAPAPAAQAPVRESFTTGAIAAPVGYVAKKKNKNKKVIMGDTDEGKKKQESYDWHSNPGSQLIRDVREGDKVKFRSGHNLQLEGIANLKTSDGWKVKHGKFTFDVNAKNITGVIPAVVDVLAAESFESRINKVLNESELIRGQGGNCIHCGRSTPFTCADCGEVVDHGCNGGHASKYHGGTWMGGNFTPGSGFYREPPMPRIKNVGALQGSPDSNLPTPGPFEAWQPGMDFIEEMIDPVTMAAMKADNIKAPGSASVGPNSRLDKLRSRLAPGAKLPGKAADDINAKKEMEDLKKGVKDIQGKLEKP